MNPLRYYIQNINLHIHEQFHFAYTIQIINRLSNHEIVIIIQNMLNLYMNIILTFEILIIIIFLNMIRRTNHLQLILFDMKEF